MVARSASSVRCCDVFTEDLAEVGRLLGRNGGVLIAHGAWTAERLEHLRQGVAGNAVPPIFLQAPDERTAVQQAMNMLRANDVLLVLAEDPEATVSLIQRRLRRLPRPTPERSDNCQGIMTVGTSNSAVADVLERHGRLLEIVGESPFRTRAFVRAADSIRLYPERVAELAAEGRLREIPGIGEGISAAIVQILETGSFDAHRHLTDRIPETLAELTAIPGIGAKTALRLHSDLGVDSLPALEAALVSGRVRAARGLGARAEAAMLAGIEAVQRRSGRTPLGIALPAARAFMAALSALRPDDTVSLAGSARRWEVTVGDLDFVVGSNGFRATGAAISSLAMVTDVDWIDDQSLRVVFASGQAADVYLSQPAAWGTTLLRATGTADHLERLGSIPDQAATEEEVYASRGLPFIPPELRSGREEFERFAEIQSLVTLGDINGEFHAHTTWSDGAASVREMADAAAARGYSLLGITDHSQGLAVAGGLDVERLRLQRIEIARRESRNRSQTPGRRGGRGSS